MSAFFLSLLLIGGSAAYVAWAAHLIVQGAPAWWFVVGAPVAAFALPFMLTSAWFTMAWVWRTPRPPEAQLTAAASLRMFGAEVLTVAASWLWMALHALLIRHPPPALATRPVVLIHGVVTNDGMWFWLRRYLARHRVGPVYTVNYGPPLADIESFTAQLAAKIDQVRAATGAAGVALVGHSMGGLVARAYLRRYGDERVTQLMTIGTPHHGSILACIVPGACLAQMRPGNAWLAALNQDEGAPLPVPTVSIWSRHDSMVVPQASCVLEGVENIALTGIGHNALLRDERVHALIAQRLTIIDTRAAPVRAEKTAAAS